MSRITVKIYDALFRQIKQKAAAEERSLQDVTYALLRQALHDRPGGRFSLRLRGWEAKEHPGVNLLDCDFRRLQSLKIVNPFH